MRPPEVKASASSLPSSTLGAGPAAAGPAISWPHRLALLLLAGVATAVRLLHLVSKPYWFDECFSVGVARIGWHDFLRLLWWREANMSLYYALLRIWLHLGHSEFFIRSLSVVIAAATLPAIYWLAGLLYDRHVALIAAALFSFNAYSVRYAQEARSYALFLLLATLSSGFLIAFLREPVRRNWLGYVVFSILAAYAHFYALLLVVAQWSALRWPATNESGSAVWVRLRRGWIVIGVAVLPLLVFVAKTGAGPIRWIQRPGIRDLLEFYEHLAGGSNWALLAICGLAGIAAVIPVGKKLLARDQNWEAWRIQFLLIWLLFPVALTALLSFARPVFLGRYMIFCLPALLILAAAGLARVRPPWLLAVTLAGVLLLGLQGIVFVYGHDYDNERDASGAASNFILEHAEPGDGIVFHIAGTRVAYEFFRSRRAEENIAGAGSTGQLGPEILFPRHGAALDYRDFTGKPTEEWVRTIGNRRVWVMLMNNGSAEKPDPTTVMLSRALPDSFPRMVRWQFTKVEVRVYSRK